MYYGQLENSQLGFLEIQGVGLFSISETVTEEWVQAFGVTLSGIVLGGQALVMIGRW